MPQSLAVYFSGVDLRSGWDLVQSIVTPCVQYRLEKGEFGWVFRQRGKCALDYVGDRFAVRVDDISLLGRKLPSA